MLGLQFKQICIANEIAHYNDNFTIDFYFYFFVEVLAQGEVTHEAQHLIIKIRRQVRLLNRKWTELNQGCHEWQSRIGHASEVELLFLFSKCFLFPFTQLRLSQKVNTIKCFRFCQDIILIDRGTRTEGIKQKF